MSIISTFLFGKMTLDIWNRIANSNFIHISVYKETIYIIENKKIS